MKNHEILNLASALKSLDECKHLPANTAYAVAKNIRKIATVTDAIEAVRQKIAKDIPVSTDGSMDQSGVEAATKKFGEFLQEENGDFDPHCIRFSDLNLWDGNGDPEKFNVLKPSTIASLEPILVGLPVLTVSA